MREGTLMAQSFDARSLGAGEEPFPVAEQLTTEANGFASFSVSDNPASDHTPLWSPDGRRIVFSSSRAGKFDLYEKPASGAGPDETLPATDADKFPTDWSRDGRFMVYPQDGQQTKTDLWVLLLAGDRKAAPFLATPASERVGRFLPDGRWLAHTSDESGRDEAYVQS